MRLEELVISAYSVFIVHRYQYHGECGLQSFHDIRYHTYLIFTSFKLYGDVAFVYKSSFSILAKPATRLGEVEKELNVG